jgi:hypothetical protein
LTFRRWLIARNFPPIADPHSQKIELCSKARAFNIRYCGRMKLTSFYSQPVATGATERQDRLFFVLLNDWTWWAWALTTILLAIGLGGFPGAFMAALGITAVQTIVILIREKRFSAFPVQLRVTYLALLAICFIPSMQWLYWLPMVGTFALVTFGYCLLARVLSLLPWNRHEALSTDLLLRTFLSRPDLTRLSADARDAGCVGGLCTIDAQIQRKHSSTIC